MITYAVTCNHIHLLAVDSGKDVISKSMQLLSGNTGQAYNVRKNRKGAFREDRFYTTAIENGVHLLRCMAYIELNMVRAGVVKHPKDWEFCGYNEILDPPRRCRLIDRNALLSSCGITDPDEFRIYYKELVADTLQYGTLRRESIWSNNLAVGSRQYIEQNQDKFGRQYNSMIKFLFLISRKWGQACVIVIIFPIQCNSKNAVDNDNNASLTPSQVNGNIKKLDHRV